MRSLRIPQNLPIRCPHMGENCRATGSTAGKGGEVFVAIKCDCGWLKNALPPEHFSIGFEVKK